MAALASSSSPFEIDNQVYAWVFKCGCYRIIVKSTSSIKYLALANAAPSFPDIRGERLNFNPVPDGDWNVGYLKREANGVKHFLDSVVEQSLAAVEKIWHPRDVDHMELRDAQATEFQLQSTGQIFSAVYNHHFGVEKVVVNTEWCLQDIYGVNHETEIYSLIENQGIGPRFLAHVTENKNRVIGYMVEMVTARRPTIDDLPACRNVLSKLHNLGIAHGTLRDTDCLVTHDGTLHHNFAGSYRTKDKDMLDAEMAGLEGLLRNAKQQPDGQIRKIGIELSAEIRTISIRDDGLHPLLWDQAFQDGKVTITPEEQGEMLDDLRKNGWGNSVDG